MSVECTEYNEVTFQRHDPVEVLDASESLPAELGMVSEHAPSIQESSQINDCSRKVWEWSERGWGGGGAGGLRILYVYLDMFTLIIPLSVPLFFFFLLLRQWIMTVWKRKKKTKKLNGWLKIAVSGVQM